MRVRLRTPMKRSLIALCASLLAFGFALPVPAAATNARVDVRIPVDGLWTAFLVGFDPAQVRSVTYYWMDAAGKWRHSPRTVIAPFSAAIPWWEGDNSGYEAVTAHVELKSGEKVNDPGGWHWVDGHHVNPKGSLTASTDGSTYAATYTPAAEAGEIASVEFWIKDVAGHWFDGGRGIGMNGAWRAVPLLGQGGKPFQATAESLAVHVIWPSGRHWVDPVRWTTNFEHQATLQVLAPAPASSLDGSSVARPKPELTPGANFPGVTAADVCQVGWARSHRHVELAQYLSVYSAYGVAYPEPAGSYELDHLIPLELGGSNENANLWPQPSAGVGFHQKDALENRLHELVCAGKADLKATQAALASDWFAVYIKNFAVGSAQTPAPVSIATPVLQGSVAAPPPPEAPPVLAPPTAVPPPPPPAAASGLCGAPSNPWGYNLCGRGGLITNPPGDFCSYFAPCVGSFWTSTNGYVVQCVNGRWSHSGGVRGVCNKDGGAGPALNSGP